MTSPSWVGLACVVALITSAGVASAADDEATVKARIHLRAGIANYDEGRYAEAANEVEQAYAIKPVPDLQYNLAQCYERLNRLEDAAQAYKSYLATRRDAPDRDVVKKRIDNLELRAKALAEQRAVPAPEPQEKIVWRTLVVYRAVPPPPGRAARAAAYALGAFGLAGIATGITFAVLTGQASNEIHDGGNTTNPPAFDGDARAKQAAAQLYPIGTGVGFGVGGLALGGAVGLWFVGRKTDQDAQRARDAEQARIPTVAPFWARSGAVTVGGVAVAGRF